jgi:hypothetical protein
MHHTRPTIPALNAVATSPHPGIHAQLRTDPRPPPGQVQAHGQRALPGLRATVPVPGPPAPEHLPVGNGRRGQPPLPAREHRHRADDRHRRPPHAGLQLGKPRGLPGPGRTRFGALPAAVREPPLRQASTPPKWTAWCWKSAAWATRWSACSPPAATCSDRGYVGGPSGPTLFPNRVRPEGPSVSRKASVTPNRAPRAIATAA